METVEALQWLKKEGILEESKKYVPQVKKVFSPCLGIKNERLLIIGDTGVGDKQVAAIMTGAYYLAAEEMNLDIKLILQEPKSRGQEAEEDVIKSLENLPEGNIIILNMSDKLGAILELGKSFRKWVKKREHRFVSAMSLGDLTVDKIHHVVDAMDLSYTSFQQKHDEMKKLMDEAKEIHVTTGAGTDLYFNKEGIMSMKADANYTSPGSGGNLPAGEVYCPPNGKNVNGKVVIDGSSRVKDGTIVIEEPITLHIKDGNIEKIEGGLEAKKLEETLEWAASQAKNPGSVRRISEFGIGLNPKATIIGATIVDEKMLGSAHIGIGSNYWFGGTIYAIIHLDQVFLNPIIEFDGKKIDV